MADAQTTKMDAKVETVNVGAWNLYSYKPSKYEQILLRQFCWGGGGTWTRRADEKLNFIFYFVQLTVAFRQMKFK